MSQPPPRRSRDLRAGAEAQLGAAALDDRLEPVALGRAGALALDRLAVGAASQATRSTPSRPRSVSRARRARRVRRRPSSST